MTPVAKRLPINPGWGSGGPQHFDQIEYLKRLAAMKSHVGAQNMLLPTPSVAPPVAPTIPSAYVMGNMPGFQQQARPQMPPGGIPTAYVMGNMPGFGAPSPPPLTGLLSPNNPAMNPRLRGLPGYGYGR
jgi:hypothetical protein